jgi:hypothetical protein
MGVTAGEDKEYTKSNLKELSRYSHATVTTAVAVAVPWYAG